VEDVPTTTSKSQPSRTFSICSIWRGISPAVVLAANESQGPMLTEPNGTWTQEAS
jgi:hypothetical protein